MKINVLTVFPESFEYLSQYGVLGKAIENGIIELEIINIRDYSKDKHKKTDDEIYGGGCGMVMTCQPIVDAIEARCPKDKKIYFMSAQGKVLNQEKLKSLAKEDEITLLCGHYEGVDARVVNHYVDEEISLGDYVLTGGEMAAMVLIDGVSRMIDGVLGNEESAKTDSHYDLLLQEDIYTRPREYRGYHVPEVLLDGNHKKIQEWREQSALENTKKKRPDLYQKYLEQKEQ